MRLPTIQGLIDRRVLVNYRVQADVLQRQVPAPFRVQEVSGFGIAGICLIRLTGVRPRLLPALFGISSENAAHRIAVEWDTDQGVREGVFIPRRDTSSWLNTVVGGRLFPGEHQRADFEVRDSGDEVAITLRSRDGATRVAVEGSVTDRLPDTSIFDSIDAASSFFERGAIGYSATRRPDCFECLELSCEQWNVLPLQVRHVESSFFADPAMFPPGSVTFDSALLMRGIPHQWHAGAPMYRR